MSVAVSSDLTCHRVPCVGPRPSNRLFLQPEDGIRAGHVTGVQTCALPIWAGGAGRSIGVKKPRTAGGRAPSRFIRLGTAAPRSEERRVGREGTCPRAAEG